MKVVVIHDISKKNAITEIIVVTETANLHEIVPNSRENLLRRLLSCSNEC